MNDYKSLPAAGLRIRAAPGFPAPRVTTPTHLFFSPDASSCLAPRLLPALRVAVNLKRSGNLHRFLGPFATRTNVACHRHGQRASVQIDHALLIGFPFLRTGYALAFVVVSFNFGRRPAPQAQVSPLLDHLVGQE